MKKLFFILLSVCSLKSFSQSNGQIAVYTGASSTTGYSSLTFSTGGGFPALHLGTYSSGGNAFNMGDSVNSGYLVNTLNEWNGTAAFSGYTAQNNLRHTVAMEVTSQNYTGAGDVAYLATSAAGAFIIQAQATPITLQSVGGVIPVTVANATAMNAITGATDGQNIYRSDTHTFWYYKNGTWTEQNATGGGNTIYTGDGTVSGDRTISGGGSSTNGTGHQLFIGTVGGSNGYFSTINLVANNSIQIGNNTGAISILGGISYSGSSFSDANGTLASNFTQCYLPQITANRTVTLSSLNQGQVVTLYDINTSAFHWSIAGLTVKDLSGNTITTLTNGRSYDIVNTGAGYITTIHQ